ncbi:MAG: hypothetical protein A2046_06590 [Bacteroidetes bacterium GWA2_30_7]|nr:MAG: hypothetical protein A2046_06590 [Bacteroidetes bacterium GWA2_30_7]
MSSAFKLSEAVSIAIHSMMLIAQSTNMMNVIQVSKRLDASKHHVAKILQRLVKDDFLNSIRGPKGGFILKKKASEITLYDIYKSIEGELSPEYCVFETKICPFDKCIMGVSGNKFTTEFVNYLKSETLDKYQNFK